MCIVGAYNEKRNTPPPSVKLGSERKPSTMDYRAGLHIDPTAHIAKSATVIGDVTIGPDVTVLQGAAIRGDFGGSIKIGAGANIQENCCVHVNTGEVTRIGENVTVGHGAIIHGCEIGDGSLIGMGAIVIDRARVGKHCLVGAGSLVTGTADIPNGWMAFGSPAKPIRPLRDDELAKLADAAEEYRAIGHDMEAQGLLQPGCDYDPTPSAAVSG